MEARVRERGMWTGIHGGAVDVAIFHFANIENSIAQCRCNDGDFLIALLFSTQRKNLYSIASCMCTTESWKSRNWTRNKR